MVRISGRQFSRIHYDQAHKQSNKTIKSIKVPIEFVNHASDELKRSWEIVGPKIAKYSEYVEAKHSNVPTKMTPIIMRITLHITLSLGKITLPYLEDSS